MSFPRAALSFRPWLSLALVAVACAGIARSGRPALDACSLLTAADIERVQGGALREAISSGNAAETVATTQCFFRVDSFSSSVSLLACGLLLGVPAWGAVTAGTPAPDVPSYQSYTSP